MGTFVGPDPSALRWADWGRWARWVCDAMFENFHGDVALYIDVYIHLYTTGIVRGILCMVKENMVENIRHIPNCFVFGSFCVRELQQHEVWTTAMQTMTGDRWWFRPENRDDWGMVTITIGFTK